MTSKRSVGIGQVGVGYWGKNLLRNFASLETTHLVHVCDQREDVLKSTSAGYPGTKASTRYEDLLDNPDVEAVVVATETPQHFEVAKKALESGRHVFVEKPMAQTVAEAEELVALAEARNLRLMVGHLLLYHPAFVYVEELIRTGGLGDVYYMYSTRVNLGIIRQRENALESLAPHDISVALQFLGRRPVAASAQGQAYLQDGIADVAFATIFFEDGRLAHLHTSWLDPQKMRRVTVVGSDKMAVIDDVATTEKVKLFDKGVEMRPGERRYADYVEAMSIRTGDIHVPNIKMQEPLRIECQHFANCVLSGETPRSDGRNGLDVVRVLDAAQRSLAKNGASVDIA